MRVKAMLLMFGTLFIVFSANTYALSDEILITEIQTQSSESAKDELVIIKNNTSIEVDLNGISIQYKSANGSSWLNRADLSGELAPSTELTISTDNDLLTSGMSSKSGHIRIYHAEKDIEYDLVGWGDAIEPLVEPANAHGPGDALVRQVNEDGLLVNTKNNFHDFKANEELAEPTVNGPTNEEKNPYSIVGVTNDPVEIESSLERLEVQNTTYPVITITELMPDPTSPLTDSEDEYVEIHNSNTEAINIEGYIINTGTTGKGFVLPAYVMQPGQYLAIYSEDSGLTLSNSSASSAKVTAPNGKIVFTTSKYDKALSGGAFMLDANGLWSWTITPTPSAVNIFEAKEEDQSKSVEAEDVEEDTGEVKGVFSENTRTYSALSDRDVYTEPEEIKANKTNFFILATIGTLTLIYAGWEYRNDITNNFQKFRRYFKAR